ncbi:aspartate/glutamate racemase family protein [Lentilactobacillus buchneri]|uniref:Aspartate racemase n=1 Tax=Lentilactobacillus buchneri DSM 20057 TaxID=1423728 RepID=A0A4V3A4J6_LENBU|nr:amino acid racemase [Lentilactobacillus buchneri]WCJ51895.1 amino acid racemase [Lentilactobacillus sp. Egmn17]AEB73493.1 aspartate racemase [Lentilactobacillus buchneri NRRL B-30929]KRK69032.1 aspartate racemase [Lentilactobacillus buchneri DSM 20057]MCT2882662.1 amino acid racemase [Lentilactobacillus buchneri]MCT2898672.1 amino acid racemase [Lentilactobacillus buchneri]
MKNFFTIIGGMGTEATETFIHILNERTQATKDQDYLNYILVNHSTVPDRTDYILDHSKPNPLIPLAEDVKQQSALHPDFFAIPCNTAHYFYDELQKLTDVPILHMPKETVAAIKDYAPNAKRVGLIATEGTLHDQIYDHEIINAGYELVKPTDKIADQTMTLIYDDIKAKNEVDEGLYHLILSQMVESLKCDIVILGCTELSVAQQRAGNHDYPVIDAQTVLADKCIELAEANRAK